MQILLEDYHLLEKLANVDRERIPERVVHARDASPKVSQAFKTANSLPGLCHIPPLQCNIPSLSLFKE
ncbi:hypothetical protein BC332_30937 [Capsicum chinense]|nr:hypothetical protein BC332_30937 [Capsicum chinense]